MLELACPPAASGVGQLEWPQEVRGLLEVGTGGEDLVHEILDREDVVLAEGRLDDGVVGQGDALLLDLAVTALVDQLADGLQVGLAARHVRGVFTINCLLDLPVGDVGLNQTKHLLGGLRDLDEDTVVDLKQTEELQDLAGLGSNLVNTK